MPKQTNMSGGLYIYKVLFGAQHVNSLYAPR